MNEEKKKRLQELAQNQTKQTENTNETQNATNFESDSPSVKNTSKRKSITPVIGAVVAFALVIIIGVVIIAPKISTDESDTYENEAEETNLGNPDAPVYHSGDNGDIMDAGFTSRKITDEETAILAAQDVAEKMGYVNAFDELHHYETTDTNDGIFYKLQEYYHGIPVYQRYVTVVASENGDAQGLYTDVMDIPEDLSLNPTVTQKEAEEKVTEYMQTQEGLRDDNFSISRLSSKNLVIYADKSTGRVCPAYVVTVGNGDYSATIDGWNGDVLGLTQNIFYDCF